MNRLVFELVKDAEIDDCHIVGAGISNQRETTFAWDRKTGKPICDAVVWQCARAEKICSAIPEKEKVLIKEKTGMPLSPHFSAAKMKWIIENVPEAENLLKNNRLCLGTADTFLLFKTTGGRMFKTDFSNASRTQLFDIYSLTWDNELCKIFGIPTKCLPEVCFSDSSFGETDFDGAVSHKIPIHSMMGDSQAALYGQGCVKAGMAKVTYDTGSSIMMNTGETPIKSGCGLVSSLAWGMGGKVSYVLEGNLNYTRAVITWLKDSLGLIEKPEETESLAEKAAKNDFLYLVPAFSGLGAPYWKSEAKAAILGMNRTTGKAEIAKAALECIAYQVTDILKAMEKDTVSEINEIFADGGAAKNKFLMQFQADVSGALICTTDFAELSAAGAAYAALVSLGLRGETTTEKPSGNRYIPHSDRLIFNKKYEGWKKSVETVLNNVY